MTVLTRRSMLAGAAVAAAGARPARPDFFDGQTVVAHGVERVLTDVLAPSSSALHGGPEPGAGIALRALRDILAASRPLAFAASPVDRWGRASGPARVLLADAGETTVQAALLEAGAARVLPQSEDRNLVSNYFDAEMRARKARRGIWSLPEYDIRDAHEESSAFGFQIYRGAIVDAKEGRGRIFFNFGEDFRTDLTATVSRGEFRRWRRREPPEAYAGKRVELRGVVEAINGPSIDLRHELQLRLL